MQRADDVFLSAADGRNQMRITKTRKRESTKRERNPHVPFRDFGISCFHDSLKSLRPKRKTTVSNTDEHRWGRKESVVLLSVFIGVHLWLHFFVSRCV
jgi:hypothetical protein